MMMMMMMILIYGHNVVLLCHSNHSDAASSTVYMMRPHSVSLSVFVRCFLVLVIEILVFDQLVGYAGFRNRGLLF